MATEIPALPATRWSFPRIGARHHRAALMGFAAIVVAHWAEHIVQAIQVYALGWPLPRAKGVLGLWFPWLVTSEWLHYGYALIMLVGLILLRRGFSGTARGWWTTALVIQAWHHVEHLLLLVQAWSGSNFWGKPAPTSVAQLIVPRLELHLFYNMIVTIPMVVAMYLYFKRSDDRAAAGVR